MLSLELKQYIADKHSCDLKDVVEDLLVPDVVHAGDCFAGFVDQLEQEFQSVVEKA